MSEINNSHKNKPIIKHLIKNDNYQLVEVRDKKLSLLRVCIRINARWGDMTRICYTLGTCLEIENGLSKKKGRLVAYIRLWKWWCSLFDWGWLWTDLQIKKSVVESVSCWRGQRDTLWVEGEEARNYGGGRRKNLPVAWGIDSQTLCFFVFYVCLLWESIWRHTGMVITVKY